MTSTRTESDSLGDVEVPNERLWGAQTARSLKHFSISTEAMPEEVIRNLAQVKKAAATANAALGVLEEQVAQAIVTAADEVISGRHAAEFPLLVWQTGSGTQTNMNMNEVLANRASEILGGARGQARVIHPNDHVNRGQSSNDVFSATLNIACVEALSRAVIPELHALRDALQEKASAFDGIVKIGRTHLQDATPLTLGQELSGWVRQLEQAQNHLVSAIPHLGELALGGTAVGTGLNAHPGYAERVAKLLSDTLELPLCSAPNKFEALAAHDAVVFAHGGLKTLAVALTKIANDVRWLASGPRCGLGEISIPSNEPGSSIMPGKVNPTQCEALLMCCAQVLGNDVTVNVAGASGNFELNVCKPVLAYNFLQSARMLSGAMNSFRRHLVLGMEPNRERIDELVNDSLMLVTALAPHIGYDKASKIATRAHESGSSLREAALESGYVSEDEFDRHVKTETMVRAGPGRG